MCAYLPELGYKLPQMPIGIIGDAHFWRHDTRQAKKTPPVLCLPHHVQQPQLQQQQLLPDLLPGTLSKLALPPPLDTHLLRLCLIYTYRSILWGVACLSLDSRCRCPRCPRFCCCSSAAALILSYIFFWLHRGERHRGREKTGERESERMSVIAI